PPAVLPPCYRTCATTVRLAPQRQGCVIFPRAITYPPSSLRASLDRRRVRRIRGWLWLERQNAPTRRATASSNPGDATGSTAVSTASSQGTKSSSVATVSTRLVADRNSQLPIPNSQTHHGT